jgi:hypothetical protein
MPKNGWTKLGTLLSPAQQSTSKASAITTAVLQTWRSRPSPQTKKHEEARVTMGRSIPHPWSHPWWSISTKQSQVRSIREEPMEHHAAASLPSVEESGPLHFFLFPVNTCRQHSALNTMPSTLINKVKFLTCWVDIYTNPSSGASPLKYSTHAWGRHLKNIWPTLGCFDLKISVPCSGASP